MRQEVDIRYVVTSLEGSAQHLYEDVYCQRGQMENLIKLHKAQLASDRMSCHNATANQVRLALHTAAFWLMHCLRSAIPQTNPLARCEFATLRERLIKIGARVIEASFHDTQSDTSACALLHTTSAMLRQRLGPLRRLIGSALPAICFHTAICARRSNTTIGLKASRPVGCVRR
jgi:hypothetical protein